MSFTGLGTVHSLRLIFHGVDRVSSVTDTIQSKVRALGGAISILGGTGILVTNLGEQFGFLSKKQAESLDKTFSLVAAVGSLSTEHHERSHSCRRRAIRTPGLGITRRCRSGPHCMGFVPRDQSASRDSVRSWRTNRCRTSPVASRISPGPIRTRHDRYGSYNVSRRRSWQRTRHDYPGGKDWNYRASY